MKPIIKTLTVALLLACLVVNTTPPDAGHIQAVSRGYAAALVENTGSILTVVPVWSTEGDQVSAEYGYTVASAGDVNADGYSDIIVGAAKYEYLVYREGAAFVFLGSEQGVSTTPGWVTGGGQSGARFGNDVASAGDVNGDGYDDVIIGANRYNNDNSEEGAAYLFYGSSTGLENTAGWMFESNITRAEFGYAVSSAGDINKDGYDDVVIGARYYSQAEENEGAIYVFLGSQAGLGTLPAWVFESGQVGASLGTSVAAAGDVNGDGFDDLIAGAPYFTKDQTRWGAAFIYLGGTTGLDASRAWQMFSDQAESGYGHAVGSAGDVNHDGLDDWMIGAPLYDREQPDEGAAFVYLGSGAAQPAAWSWMAAGGQSYSGYGVAVGTAGDVNRDGYSDVFAGAHMFDDDQSAEGTVFVYLGSRQGPAAEASWWSRGDKADTYYGFSAGAAGDINGDGLDDLIVGAPLYKHDLHTVMGRAFLYLGEPGSTSLDVRLFLPLLASPFSQP